MKEKDMEREGALKGNNGTDYVHTCARARERESQHKGERAEIHGERYLTPRSHLP